MDKDKILEDIFGDDPLDLLKVKPKATAARNADERLMASFEEVNAFFEQHGREPEPKMTNISEYQLYTRLKAIRESGEKVAALGGLDRYSLLGVERKEIESIDDIFGDDSLDILGGDDAGLYDFVHTPKDFKREREREEPDYVAQRKPCEEFEEFEHLFLQCHADLRKGYRKMVKFEKELQINKGDYFILRGVMIYVVHKDDLEVKRGKKNARLRVIYENGTESDLLMRSLSIQLYRDGKRVTEHEAKYLDGMEVVVGKDDIRMGLIYVLESLSAHPEIKGLKHLYKIGYTGTSVESRIKNAEKERTFLMAKVRVVRTYQCYNLNAQKLELLLHTFFGRACLNIEIVIGKRKVRPREWFVVPLEVIDDVVKLIESGQIVHYRYDVERELIVARG